MKFSRNPRTKKLTRRTLLRSSVYSINAAVALPLLEAMYDSDAAYAQAQEDATRFVAMYVPNGIIEEKWFPPGTAKEGWTLKGTSLEAFETLGLINDISFYQKMTNASGFGSAGNGHLTSISSWLTGKTIPNDDLAKFRWSLDQEHSDWMNQKELGTTTNLPNPDAKVLRMAGSSELDTGRMQYNNEQKNALNWSKAGTILALDSDIRKQFDQLYSVPGSGGGGGISRRTLRQISVLDDVKDDCDALANSNALSSEDRRRFRDYCDATRDIELDLDRMVENPVEIDCDAPFTSAEMPDDPAPNPNRKGSARTITPHITAAVKLVPHAFSCGLIHSATYCAGGEAAGCLYADIGVGVHYHNAVSHNRAANYDKWVRVDTYHADYFAQLMYNMKNTPNGLGKNLLDNTGFMFGSGLGNGDRHQKTAIAMLVGGHIGNWQHGKRHILREQKHSAVNDTIRRELKMQTIGEGEVPIS